jgi:hypothetical protein
MSPQQPICHRSRMTPMYYREIAEQLGINRKSVATLLTRALHKLQRAAGVESRRPSIKLYTDLVCNEEQRLT